MKLFPQSEEWLLKELLEEPDLKVSKIFCLIKALISWRCDAFQKYSYQDLLYGFNMFIENINSKGTIDEKENNLNISYADIKILINESVLLFKSGDYTNLVISKYDVCVLLLAIKKIEETKITNISNLDVFINEIVAQFNNSKLIENGFNNPFLIDFLSYENVLDDEFMSQLFLLQDPIPITKLISGEFSYLFLNEKFKKLTYGYFDFINYLMINLNSTNFNKFKKDFIKYNPIELTCHSELNKENNTVLIWVSNFADDNIKNDKEIVIAKIQKHGKALGFDLENLKDNKVTALAAIQNNNFN